MKLEAWEFHHAWHPGKFYDVGDLCVVDGQVWVCAGASTGDEPGSNETWVQLQTGGGSAPAQEDVGSVPFTWQTQSPVVLEGVGAGDLLDRVSLQITTPFDDPNASIRVGTQLFTAMQAGDYDLTQAGQYETELLIAFDQQGVFSLTIDPQSSTQGEGLLLWKIRKAQDPLQLEEDVNRADFAFVQQGVLLLEQVTQGFIFDHAALLVTEPFDDPDAYLTLGTTANPSAVFQAQDTKLQLKDQYDSDSLYVFPANDFFILTLNPGASTQGTAVLLYKIRRG